MEIIPDPIHVALLAVPFVVAVVGLHLILWRPLLAWLYERDQVTNMAMKEAEELDLAAQEQLARIEARLTEARGHAASVRQAARDRALAREAEIVSAARRRAEQEIEVAVGQIRTERDAATVTLRGTARELSTHIAARVLGRELS